MRGVTDSPLLDAIDNRRKQISFLPSKQFRISLRGRQLCWLERTKNIVSSANSKWLMRGHFVATLIPIIEPSR